MKTFYIIQMLDGRYLAKDTEVFTQYCDNMGDAQFFHSEEEAIDRAPAWAPFTIIKFYDK